MIPLLTAAAARAMDAAALRDLGVPTLVLMENAGRGATGVLLDRFGAAAASAVIVGGVGQNGGDAWVLARHLVAMGMRPKVFVHGDVARIAGDARVNFDALAKLGLAVESVQSGAELGFASAVGAAGVIVDGLFATGLTRPVTGATASLIGVINQANCPRFALDLPSGVHADTGAVLGTAVVADVTATFGAHKRGLHQFPGAEHAGEVVLVSLGIPAPADAETTLWDGTDVARVVAPRSPSAHKGAAGHVLVVAGSEGMTGAAVLSAMGALRAGAGKVTLFARAAVPSAPADLMVHVLSNDGDAAAAAVIAAAKGAQTAVLGPGLGTDEVGRALAVDLALSLPIPTVLDADALTALAADPSVLRRALAPRVLTPHPGEAGRLLASSSDAVQRDRYGAATQLAAITGHVAVLKGARTVVASVEGALRVCRHGSPAMAVAGAGDVLAGVIAAHLVALGPAEAAIVGVILHAMAGEGRARGDRGLLASDLAEGIPDALAAAFAP